MTLYWNVCHILISSGITRRGSESNIPNSHVRIQIAIRAPSRFPANTIYFPTNVFIERTTLCCMIISCRRGYEWSVRMNENVCLWAWQSKMFWNRTPRRARIVKQLFCFRTSGTLFKSIVTTRWKTLGRALTSCTSVQSAQVSWHPVPHPYLCQRPGRIIAALESFFYSLPKIPRKVISKWLIFVSYVVKSEISFYKNAMDLHAFYTPGLKQSVCP